MTPAEKVKHERALLEKLVDLGNKFRNAEILDEDFVYHRDGFDICLKQATQYIKNNEAVKVSCQSMIIDGCMGYDNVIVTTIR